jgi:hypothetical protein
MILQTTNIGPGWGEWALIGQNFAGYREFDTVIAPFNQSPLSSGIFSCMFTTIGPVGRYLMYQR